MRACLYDPTRIRAEPHGTAHIAYVFLFLKQADNGCGVFLLNSVEFAFFNPHLFLANSITAHCMPAYAQKRDPVGSCEIYGLDLSLDAAPCRIRRHKDPGYAQAAKLRRFFNFFRIYFFDLNLRIIGYAAWISAS